MTPLKCKMKMSLLSYYKKKHQEPGRCFFERRGDIYHGRYKEVQHNGALIKGNMNNREAAIAWILFSINKIQIFFSLP